jgi:uncharacterized protein YchJ
MKGVSARLLPFLLVLAMSGAPGLAADNNNAPAAPELTRLLHEFLKAASVNDRAVFERFFGDDLIYTRSAGVTINKEDIMRGFDQPKADGDAEATRAQERAASTYDGDEVTVHQYGDTAIVNFRLIAQNRNGSEQKRQYYRNTATFVKRAGQWQAVAWQSTRVPETDKEKVK